VLVERLDLDDARGDLGFPEPHNEGDATFQGELELPLDFGVFLVNGLSLDSE